MLIDCYGIRQEFVVTYIIVHEIKFDELQLEERQQKKTKVFFIKNYELIKKIESSLNQYRQLNKTLSEYFGRSIIYAQKNEHKVKRFILKETKNITKPLLLFKIRNRCHLNQNLDDVISTKPVRMSLNDILILYGIKDKFDMDNLDKFEEKHQIQFHFSKLITLMKNSKQTIVGRKSPIVPGIKATSWNPRYIINIG